MTLFNRVKQTTATTGTGTITLGAAVDGYQTYAAAGATDGQAVNYAIEDGTAWEYGTGTYSSGTLSRDNIEESSNGGAAIDLSGSAVVFCDAFAGDLQTEILLREVNVTSQVSEIEIKDIPNGDYSKIILRMDNLRVEPQSEEFGNNDFYMVQISGDNGETYFEHFPRLIAASGDFVTAYGGSGPIYFAISRARTDFVTGVFGNIVFTTERCSVDTKIYPAPDATAAIAPGGVDFFVGGAGFSNNSGQAFIPNAARFTHSKLDYVSGKIQVYGVK